MTKPEFLIREVYMQRKKDPYANCMENVKAFHASCVERKTFILLSAVVFLDQRELRTFKKRAFSFLKDRQRTCNSLGVAGVNGRR